MSCGYLFDLIDFIKDGYVRETVELIDLYYSCMMLS